MDTRSVKEAMSLKVKVLLEEKRKRYAELGFQLQQLDAQRQQLISELLRLEGEIRLLQELDETEK